MSGCHVFSLKLLWDWLYHEAAVWSFLNVVLIQELLLPYVPYHTWEKVVVAEMNPYLYTVWEDKIPFYNNFNVIEEIYTDRSTVPTDPQMDINKVKGWEWMVHVGIRPL